MEVIHPSERAALFGELPDAWAHRVCARREARHAGAAHNRIALRDGVGVPGDLLDQVARPLQCFRSATAGVSAGWIGAERAGIGEADTVPARISPLTGVGGARDR